MKKKIISLLIVVALVLSFVGCSDSATPAAKSSEEPEEKPFRVAMVMSGPINDAGWNESAYKGLMNAESELGVEVAYSENVAMPDFETAIRSFADQGYDLIIPHGFSFTDATLNVAPDYPEQFFIIVNGSAILEPNVGAFRSDSAQIGFIAGTLAGLLTESDMVGIMVASKTPNYQATMDGFEAAAKYVNGNVKVFKAYTDSNSDLQKGREIGLAMAEQGADIISCNANQVGLGSIEAAKTAGIHAIGFISDQYEVAPETVYASSILDISKLVFTIIKVGTEGGLTAEIRLNGVSEGVIGVSSWHQHENIVTPAMQNKLDEVIAGLEDGSLRKNGILLKPQY